MLISIIRLPVILYTYTIGTLSEVQVEEKVQNKAHTNLKGGIQHLNPLQVFPMPNP